jgi:DNA polymerase elongation subunit (family B)
LGLSFYGELGNNRSRFYNPILAEAVTLAGQHFLKYTMELAEQQGYVPLYGDTDSMFIQLNRDEAKKFEEFCNNHYVDYCHEKYGARKDWCNISLEYENYFDRIFFVTKKRYAGLMKYYKGKEADYIEVKGFEMMRSDGLGYMRDLQEDVIGKILRDAIPASDLHEFLAVKRDEVFHANDETSKLNYEDFVITQSVSKHPREYKSKLVHVGVAKWLIDNDMEFYVGMKIPYIITSSKPKLGAVHPDIFDPDRDKFDTVCYWNSKIFPAIERIIMAVYPDHDWDDLYLDNKLRIKSS